MRHTTAVLELKTFDDETRIIEGIASTPAPDRGGDIIEPLGAEFTLPIPFLWHHDQRQPIGEVFAVDVTPDGIAIKARIAHVTEPGPLQTRLDEAYQAIKARLVRGLSIGWTPIKTVPNPATRGIRAIKWAWAELSAVTLPQNTHAAIVSVKTATPRKDRSAMTIAEQITAFENSRAAKTARMNAIMTEAAGENATLDEDRTTEYDGLATEIKSVDAHLVRLRDLERFNAAAAVPVKPTIEVKTIAPVITVKPNVEPGTGLVRFAQAMLATKGNLMMALEYSK